MAGRQSINFPGLSHQGPIPNASRVGNILMSRIIGGSDTATREPPATLEVQIANVFGYIKSAVEAAGGTTEDIVKINFFVKDPATQRAALNAEWVKMFADPNSRPARHTQALPADSRGLVHAAFVTVLP